MPLILVVDDDPHVLQLVTIQLQQEGYKVISALNATEALNHLMHKEPSIAIVDVMMPGMNGFELTKELTTVYKLPVILLTAKGELSDKAKGFTAGSDDYLVKPFELQELLFRIRAILRRMNKAYEDVIQVRNVTINYRDFEVMIGNRTIMLPLKEFEVLALLATRFNKIFTREAIIAQVWGLDYEGDEKTLTTHIHRIRERLLQYEANLTVITVRGVGYKLC